MTAEPSVLPLSATITSAETPSFSAACCAFWMQRAIVSASFRHGITIETSTAARVRAAAGRERLGATFLAGQRNDPGGGSPWKKKRPPPIASPGPVPPLRAVPPPPDLFPRARADRKGPRP